MIRRVVFWSHLGSAVCVGTVILILAITGALLAYEDQIVARAERAYFADPPSDRTRLSVERLVEAAERHDPRFRATAIMVQADPRAAVQVFSGRTTRIYLDPYRGDVVGEGFPRLEGFFEGVQSWHRWLNVATPSIRNGRAVTGAANVVFFFLVLSGLFLWFPRRWSWKRLRAVAFFRRGVSGRARDFNWHNTIGVWSVLPLLGIISSAFVISYPSLADRVYPGVGQFVQARGLPELSDVDRAPSPTTSTVELTSALDVARSSVGDWRRILLSIPPEGADAVSFQIDAGSQGQPQRAGTLLVDRSGARTWETFADLPPERRAQSFLRYAHTGQYWGLVGQTLAGLFSLAAAMMVWTGLSLAFRRLRSALRRRSRRAAAAGR